MSYSQLLIESGNVALLEQAIIDAVQDACIHGGEEAVKSFETYAKILETKDYEPQDEFEQSLDDFFEPFFENSCAVYGSFLFEAYQDTKRAVRDLGASAYYAQNPRTPSEASTVQSNKTTNPNLESTIRRKKTKTKMKASPKASILKRIRTKLGNGRKWLASKIRAGIDKSKAFYSTKVKPHVSSLHAGISNKASKAYNFMKKPFTKKPATKPALA